MNILKRLLASLYALAVAIIIPLYVVIGLLLGLPLSPIISWIYWLITGKSLTIEKYFNTTIFWVKDVLDKSKLHKKVKEILGWDDEYER